METIQTQDSKKSSQPETDGTSRLSFRFHARALAALGRDLVTNDVVAILELVKNSYDALATVVHVQIRTGPQGSDEEYIEISDNGHGMDYATIRDVWCVVATPHRQESPVSKIGKRSRSVTGEKGLGRLSAARLGRNIRIVTKTIGGPVLGFSVNWDELVDANDLSSVGFEVSELPKGAFDAKHGTLIRVDSLRSSWNSDKIEDLRQNLARLVSPFGSVGDFAIRLDVPGNNGDPNLQDVRPPRFMSEPKYAIEGNVGANGEIRALYRYRPIDGSNSRDCELRDDGFEEADTKATVEGQADDRSRTGCGPFQFEIRAWDLTSHDTRDIAKHFGETRRRIRGAIRSHRGLSVYRDDVLVLPKSDSTRDWLGLDLRRVSRVGPRLSTSQVVGYVRITKGKNQGIIDTSDREGLVDNSAMDAFRRLITRIVSMLEVERHSDRMTEKDTGKARDLFADLSTEPLVSKLEDLRDGGGDLGDAIKATVEFGSKLERSRQEIERRFGYYNRLAVIGTIAQMVIHEIRNCTTVIGHGLRKTENLLSRIGDKPTESAVGLAKSSVNTLESLADRFAPLASRGYAPGRRTSVVEESITRCRDMHAEELQISHVVVEVPSGTVTKVRVDPGELDAIILNLLTNSLYWMKQHKGERNLRFRLATGPNSERVTVSVDDSGPGINEEDLERVFWLGVTRRPGGIGMGLTVASELVDGHGGRMRTIVPGELGGATFEFDLPLDNEICTCEGT